MWQSKCWSVLCWHGALATWRFFLLNLCRTIVHPSSCTIVVCRFPNTFLWSNELSVNGSMFRIWSRNFLNNDPWRGFVKKSAIITPVGQYVMDTSLEAIRSSVSNKEVPNVNMSSPFTAGGKPIIFQQYGTLVVLVDKWVHYIISLCFEEIAIPKNLRHDIIDIHQFPFSGTPDINFLASGRGIYHSFPKGHGTTSVVFHIIPFPRVMAPPVWFFMSSEWTANDTSIHHLIICMLSASRVRGIDYE